MANQSKNAASFGFSPENNGDVNTLALQRAVSGGGTVYIDQIGTYDLSGTIVLDSSTKLVFGPGVVLRKVPAQDGTPCGYTFVNRGAYTRSYDHHIEIVGLHLLCNGNEAAGVEATEAIPGLRGHLSFFYIRDLVIRDFHCPDLLHSCFCIHVCTFENLILDNLYIEGFKDAVHLGTGAKFVIRHGVFKTFDDPIALNAHDYATSNPQLGWIEDGVIEDCYDLNQETTTGFFCRILAGSWCDWRSGMEVRHSDTVVYNHRLYRVIMEPTGEVYRSYTPPTHAHGIEEYDGCIRWVMVQDDDEIYNCGCRNIHFRDIFLQKKRDCAFSIHFDNDNWSHSCYPYSTMPVQEDLIFENIFIENEITHLILSSTPVNTIKLINSVLQNSKIALRTLPVEGLVYGQTDILLSGTTFKGSGAQELVRCDGSRSARLKIAASIAPDDYHPYIRGSVYLLDSDIEIQVRP